MKLNNGLEVFVKSGLELFKVTHIAYSEQDANTYLDSLDDAGEGVIAITSSGTILITGDQADCKLGVAKPSDSNEGIQFIYALDDIVVTPFNERGLVTMLGFDEGGVKYYVQTKDNDAWFKEYQLAAGGIID